MKCRVTSSLTRYRKSDKLDYLLVVLAVVKSVSEPQWSGGEASVTLKFLLESTLSKALKPQTTDLFPVIALLIAGVLVPAWQGELIS